MKISVLMGYQNRRQQLRAALRSIEASAHRDVEVIVIDDGSREDQRVDDLAGGNVVVRRIPPERHRHENPCVAYNLAAEIATGDAVVFQEASAVHAGDVLDRVARTLCPRDCLSFGCYSIGRPATVRLLGGLGGAALPGFCGQVRALLEPMRAAGASRDFDDAWYNHSRYRRHPIYFCVAMMAEDFRAMGGFDLRFAGARTYEDDDFRDRLGRAGIPIRIEDDPFVVHLWHEYHAFTRYNKDLYEATRGETGWQANGGRLTSGDYNLGLLE